MRQCGDCVACCVYLRIPELKKQACEHCQHLAVSEPIRPNVMQLSSSEPVKCQIYESRPGVCRDYKCLWLQGYGAESDRPDRSLMLIDTLHAIDGGIECKPLNPDSVNMDTVKRMMEETGKAAIITSFYERSITRVVWPQSV